MDKQDQGKDLKHINLSGWKPKRGFWKSMKSALEGVNTEGITVAMVDGDYIRRLKREFFGEDKTADVLTFVFENVKEVVVCPEHLGYDEVEVARRIIHGILHALGYDHKVETKRANMERLENKVMAKFLKHFLPPYNSHL